MEKKVANDWFDPVSTICNWSISKTFSTDKKQNKPSWFTKLPVELQTRICHFAVVLNRPIDIGGMETRHSRVYSNPVTVKAHRGTLPPAMALFKVSKQISVITSLTFYRHNVFRFKTYGIMASLAIEFLERIGANQKHVRHFQFHWKGAVHVAEQLKTILRLGPNVRHIDFVASTQAFSNWTVNPENEMLMAKYMCQFLTISTRLPSKLSTNLCIESCDQRIRTLVEKGVNTIKYWPKGKQIQWKMVRGVCACKTYDCSHAEEWRKNMKRIEEKSERAAARKEKAEQKRLLTELSAEDRSISD